MKNLHSSIENILNEIEKNITSPEEKAYFWTHSVRYLETIKRIQNITGEKKLIILDIGCFPYHVGEALEIIGHTVYGIASYHEKVKNKNIAILNIEKEKFPYKDNFFDLVLFNEVIEHLPQSPVLALKEIHRVTKKEGFMIITTPNITRSINRGKLLFGKSIMYPTDVYFEENGNGNNIYHRHNREFTLSELVELLKKTKWHVEKKEYFISYTPFRNRLVADSPILFLGKFLNYIFMRFFPTYQDTLYIIGRK